LRAHLCSNIGTWTFLVSCPHHKESHTISGSAGEEQKWRHGTKEMSNQVARLIRPVNLAHGYLHITVRHTRLVYNGQDAVSMPSDQGGRERAESASQGAVDSVRIDRQSRRTTQRTAPCQQKLRLQPEKSRQPHLSTKPNAGGEFTGHPTGSSSQMTGAQHAPATNCALGVSAVFIRFSTSKLLGLKCAPILFC
jgi:hypothetical protein